MIKLPRFLIAYNRQELPGPVILGTSYPFMVGSILMWKDEYEFINFCSNYKGLGYASIPGYNIVIYFDGLYTGPKLRIEPGVQELIKKTVAEMADFYYKEQVSQKLSFYKKFSNIDTRKPRD